MKFETLAVEFDGPIATLRLNRPERLNALNITIMRELVVAARSFDDKWDTQVVIVEGAGRAFCAGADLTEPPVYDGLPSSGNSWAQRREVGQLGRRMAEALEQMRPITIAKIHGSAVGGGLIVAAACDLRVAAEDTTLSIPEVELGIPLAWGGIPRLVRELGPALTKELVMTCRPFTAHEAKAAGFLNDVVPADELNTTVDALARRVASMPGALLSITKEHINAISTAMSAGNTSFADGDLLLGAVQDPASAEAATTYIESRMPKHG